MESFAIALACVCIFLVVPLLIWLGHRFILSPILRKRYPGISPLFAWQRVPLLRKEQLTQTEEPIFRLTFGLPPGRRLEADLGLGEFIRVKHANGGKPRSYSPTCVDVAGEFELCVKRYRAGFVSSHLCDASVGDLVEVSGPYPPFWIPFVRSNGCVRVGLVAFGVGITEALALASVELATTQHEVRLLWANRSPGETFADAQMKYLQESYPDRFKVNYIFSRSSQTDDDQLSSAALSGRVSVEVLQTVFGDWLQDHGKSSGFLVVGTKQMKRDGYAMLNQLGFRNKLIRRQPCGCFCKRAVQYAQSCPQDVIKTTEP